MTYDSLTGVQMMISYIWLRKAIKAESTTKIFFILIILSVAV